MFKKPRNLTSEEFIALSDHLITPSTILAFSKLADEVRKKTGVFMSHAILLDMFLKNVTKGIEQRKERYFNILGTDRRETYTLLNKGFNWIGSNEGGFFWLDIHHFFCTGFVEEKTYLAIVEMCKGKTVLVPKQKKDNPFIKILEKENEWS